MRMIRTYTLRCMTADLPKAVTVMQEIPVSAIKQVHRPWQIFSTPVAETCRFYAVNVLKIPNLAPVHLRRPEPVELIPVIPAAIHQQQHNKTAVKVKTENVSLQNIWMPKTALFAACLKYCLTQQAPPQKLPRIL